MKFRMLKSMFREGIIGMWRNRMMSFASVSSVTAVLIILGIILTLILNITNVANVTKQEFDSIQVSISEDATKEDTNHLKEVVSKFEEVKEIKFLPKESALKNFRKDLGEDGDLLEDLEGNPLPDSYIISLTKLENVDSLVKKLEEIKIITNIRYYKDVMEKLMTIANFTRLGGLIVITILMFISIFIISNTVKITVAARKKEINIMKYVGATNGYIRGPFIIEGILLGIIGAAIAILIVVSGYKYIFNLITENPLMTAYMVRPSNIYNDIIIIFIAIGVGIGTIGSVVSLRKFLNV